MFQNGLRLSELTDVIPRKYVGNPSFSVHSCRYNNDFAVEEPERSVFSFSYII